MVLVIIAFKVVEIVAWLRGENGIIACFVICTVIINIPCIIGIIYFIITQLTVRDREITVRNMGKAQYTVSVDDVIHITWKKFNSRMFFLIFSINLHFETIFITTPNRKFTVSSLMKNYDKMSKYILENVNQDKISFEDNSMNG
jgi:hypothetical protein